MTATARDTFARCENVGDALRVVNRELPGDRPRQLGGNSVLQLIHGGALDVRTGDVASFGGWKTQPHSIMSVTSPRGLAARGAFQGVESVFPAYTDVFASVVFEVQAAAADTARRISTQRTAGDFKTIDIGLVTSLPRPRLVAQHGERTQTGIDTQKINDVHLATFGQIYRISNEALFGSGEALDYVRTLPRLIGLALAELESDLIFNALQATANLADGTATFATSRDNISTPAADPSTASIGIAYSKLSTRNGPDGKPITYRPNFILTGTAQKWAAAAAITSVTPGGADPMLECLDDPRIDGNRWFLGCDPELQPAIARFRLDPAVDSFFPEIQIRSPFHVAGAEISVKWDGAAAIIDPAAIVRNAGS